MIWQTKTVQIESADVQWDGTEETLTLLQSFVPRDFIFYASETFNTKSHLQVWNVLEEQWLNVPIGHWVVRGLKGEFYPCDPGAMTGKYFEVKEGGEAVNLMDVIKMLKYIGETLAGDEYIKASEETEYGERLVEMAEKLEKYGIK